MKKYEKRVIEAVHYFWSTREGQSRSAGEGDRGGRAAVTGGKQMDGFLKLVTEILLEKGIPAEYIYYNTSLVLPGFYRPTKEWDMLVIHEKRLLAAMEFKSQVGPSFGNNFNNRVEEAVGSANDLHTAFRERAFGVSPAPWLGYLMLLEDCDASRREVSVTEPHYPVFSEFKDASYAKRYELFCEKLVLERLYTSTCLLLTPRDIGSDGRYSEPKSEMSFSAFIHSLVGHVKGQLDR